MDILSGYSRFVANDATIAQTLFSERRRAFASGIVESGTTTFFLLIALRWFEAGPMTKAALSAAPNIGLLLGPLAIYISRQAAIPPAHLAATLLTIAGTSFALASIAPNEVLFVLFIVIGVGLPGASVPLFTSIYQANYPAASLGRYYAQVSTLRILTSIFTATMAGLLLNRRIELYPLLIWTYAAVTLVAARAIRRCPSPTLDRSFGSGLFGGFRFLRSDRSFRNTLIFWMVMGFGTLMLAPLRVEYLAHERYGLELSEAQIALFVATIPSIARLFASRVWGWLFDTVSFFVLRISVNTGFLLGALGFFCSDGPVGLCIAAILYGISMAGGDIAWQLWTTKFAPPDRVPDYMAVHTMFTGVRGIFAPMVGFYLALHLPITTVAFIGVGLIAISNVGLFIESRRSGSLRALEKCSSI